MKALSIQSPWAWMILYSGKDIENRSWKTNFRGRVLIHVGKNYHSEDDEWIEQRYGLRIPKVARILLGGIIGSVEIVDCVQKSESKWFFGDYGFVLRNPIELPFMPCRGQLGFFNVDYKIAA